MRFPFTNTHVYPGCKVWLSDAPGRTLGDCLIEFSDGVVAPGRYVVVADALILHVQARRMAKGARIIAKAWRPEAGCRRRCVARARMAAGPVRGSGRASDRIGAAAAGHTASRAIEIAVDGSAAGSVQAPPSPRTPIAIRRSGLAARSRGQPTTTALETGTGLSWINPSSSVARRRRSHRQAWSRGRRVHLPLSPRTAARSRAKGR